MFIGDRFHEALRSDSIPDLSIKPQVYTHSCGRRFIIIRHTFIFLDTILKKVACSSALCASEATYILHLSWLPKVLKEMYILIVLVYGKKDSYPKWGF